MREVFSDFTRLEDRPDGTVRIPLGSDKHADLRDLRDGERVLVRLPGELEAEATAQSIPWQGAHFWYALVTSRTAIHIIETDASSKPAGAHATTE
jgi:hypothetical protein